MLEVDLFRKIHDDIKKLKDYENQTIFVNRIFGIELARMRYIQNYKEYFVGWHTNEQCDARNIRDRAYRDIESKTNIKNRTYYICADMVP